MLFAPWSISLKKQSAETELSYQSYNVPLHNHINTIIITFFFNILIHLNFIDEFELFIMRRLQSSTLMTHIRIIYTNH